MMTNRTLEYLQEARLAYRMCLQPFAEEVRRNRMAKAWAEGFYHSRAWRDMREYILKRDRYCCVRCKAPGQEVHHIIRLTKENIGDPKISLNPHNLELLCSDCHKREHDNERFVQPGDGKGKLSIKLDYQFDADGNLIPPGE